uniref:Uncharacterized protein n=1 Tax=candidate division WOR-3 bacterium TaxID=2052148 RepID=A0A7C6EDU9_UNCW3
MSYALVLPLAKHLTYLLPYLLGLPDAYPLYYFRLGIGASPTLAPNDLSRGELADLPPLNFEYTN